ncbi:MAG TPA: c-type cytochrome [Planctomycetaceae bacterium]|nr:c-type cytochrome [Planctomycetaceae bacterium]
MSRVLLCLVAVGLATGVAVSLSGSERETPNGPERPPAAVPRDLDRSPLAVAVSPDGRWCATANHTSDSVSLVDLKAGRVVAEHACGRGPVDLAWIDDRRLLVSLLHDDAVAVLELRNGEAGLQLATSASIPVGDEPRGIALAPERAEGGNESRVSRAFVAISGQDEIAVLDLASQKVTTRIPVGGQPRTLGASPDGRWLVTCCNVPGQVFVHDVATYQLVSRRNVFDSAFNLGNPLVLPDSSAVILASAINRLFPVREDNIEKGWAIDNRLTKLPLPDGPYWQQQQLGLDERGNACGDAWGNALSRDARWLAVTCGGTHEVLVFDYERLKFPTGDPGDFIPSELLDTPGILRRVELGGRPLGVTAVDERRLVVANSLKNALDVVDLVEAKLIGSVPLGGPAEPSLARRGEAIFYDADRSFDNWFSCHTCHPDGHTSGQTFDTVNDGNYDTGKLTPTLRGVVHTGPWTWHGWQDSLPAAIRKSMHDTLSTQKPLTDVDVDALVAYLRTLEHPVSPHRRPDGSLSEPATRGQALFEGKAGCATCHHGEHFTSAETYQVGLESKRYFYDRFNPPSLRGLHARRRFLHDGRADALEHVLTRYHAPENVAGEKLSECELADLIAYLKSL